MVNTENEHNNLHHQEALRVVKRKISCGELLSAVNNTELHKLEQN